jgi:predicted ferric reductase
MRTFPKTLFVAIAWIAAYLALVLAPLLLFLIGPVQAGLGFWWDFSMALGFSSMAMMGVQFALTARFRRATAPFGIDIIYYFHRYVAVFAFLLILAHVLIIWIDSPAALSPRNPLEAPWHMSAGRGAFLLFAAVIVTSLWRKRLRIEYDRWRLLHALLATAAFALALGHIEGTGYSLQATVKRLIWTAFTLFWILLIIRVRLIRPFRMMRSPYKVAEVRKERGSVWTLAVTPDGHRGIRFQPGQFAWLTLRASPFHLKEHPFSFSSSPARAGQLEFTIKELGDFSSTIKNIEPGEIAYLDGPYGVFTTDRYAAAPGFVFIAGGIGIAPIMSMLRALADKHDKRPVSLIYGNERWDRVVFREECESLKAGLNLDVVHVLGDPPEDWTGERGLITQEVLGRHLPAGYENFECFICGPNPMIRSVEQSLSNLRVPFRRVHSEIFDLA